MKTNENDGAFASAAIYAEGSINQSGLTKREYFAAIAMQGLLMHMGVKMNYSEIAEDARSCANALIDELNKETK